MKISVCIPMYNESRMIESTAEKLSAYMSAHFEDYEILFCDDGSSDGSADLVWALSLPCVRVTGYPSNRGKGFAIRTAMLEAEGDYVFFTDADLAYGTDVIGRAVDTFQKNPDSALVIGSRNLGKDGYEGYTLTRKLASKIYIFVLGLVGGFRLSDFQCGCKAFTRDAAKEIFSRCEVNGFAFDFEALMWADGLGMAVTEMPVKVINHKSSKIRLLRDAARMLQDLIQIRRRIKRALKEEKNKKNEKN